MLWGKEFKSPVVSLEHTCRARLMILNFTYPTNELSFNKKLPLLHSAFLFFLSVISVQLVTHIHDRVTMSVSILGFHSSHSIIYIDR